MKIKDLYSLIVFRCFSSFSRPFLFLSFLFLFLVLSPFNNTFVGCVNPFFLFLVLSPFYTFVGCVNPFFLFFSLKSLLYICWMCKSFLFLFFSLESLQYICWMCKSFVNNLPARGGGRIIKTAFTKSLEEYVIKNSRQKINF